MVQEFHILRCFSCQTFQVQQVKKVNRWSCKLCGEKQSLLKEFGRGSGTDCRHHVQKLNSMRGAMMQDRNTWLLRQQVEADREDEPEEQRDDQVTHTQVSRWSKYLDTPEEAGPEEQEEEENILKDRQQLYGNNMIDRKRKREGGWADSGGQDSWTPEQSKCSRAASASSLSRTSVSRTSPPSLSRTSPPSTKSFHWAHYLSGDCQVTEERAGASVDGWTHSVGRAASLPCSDIICQPPPLIKIRPLLPVSSMFQSDDDFSLDEF